MSTITIQEAQANLPELLHRLKPGEALQVTEGGRPVAVITGAAPTPADPAPGQRRLGTQAGSVLYMAPDFDAPLDDMREYMG